MEKILATTATPAQQGLALNKWARQTRAAVFHALNAYLTQQATQPQQSQLLNLAWQDFQTRYATNNTQLLPCLHFPLLIYLASGGRDDALGRQLSLATTLLEMGICLLDDLMDNELSTGWADTPRQAIQLTAYNLGLLAQSVLQALPVASETRVTLLRLLTQYSMKISVGQQSETLLAQDNLHNIQLTQVHESVQGKTGMWRALYAALAAYLGGGHVADTNPYANLGRELGLLRQLANDCYDLFIAPVSQDLKNGVYTLPIVTHFHTLTATEQFAFLALLAKAKMDEASHNIIRQQLIASGQLQYCLLVLELRRSKALQALALLNPPELVTAGLSAMLEEAGAFFTSSASYPN